MHSSLWWLLLTWLLPFAGPLAAAPISGPGGSASSLCLASALLSLVLLLRLPWRYRRTTNLWPDIWGITPLLLPLLFLVQALRSPHQRRQHGSLPSATAPVGRAAQKPGGSPGLPRPATISRQPRSSLYPGIPGRSARGSRGTDDGAGLAGSPGQRGYRCRRHHRLVRVSG